MVLVNYHEIDTRKRKRWHRLCEWWRAPHTHTRALTAIRPSISKIEFLQIGTQVDWRARRRWRIMWNRCEFTSSSEWVDTMMIEQICELIYMCVCEGYLHPHGSRWRSLEGMCCFSFFCSRFHLEIGNIDGNTSHTRLHSSERPISTISILSMVPQIFNGTHLWNTNIYFNSVSRKDLLHSANAAPIA